MRSVLIFASLLFIGASCGTHKDTSKSTNSNATETVVEDENKAKEVVPTDSGGNELNLTTYGVIQDKTEEGCGFVIQVMVDANTTTSTFYEPLTLPEEYQLTGKIIRIEYRMSRRPSNCTSAIPIIIDEILK